MINVLGGRRVLICSCYGGVLKGAIVLECLCVYTAGMWGGAGQSNRIRQQVLHFKGFSLPTGIPRTLDPPARRFQLCYRGYRWSCDRLWLQTTMYWRWTPGGASLCWKRRRCRQHPAEALLGSRWRNHYTQHMASIWYAQNDPSVTSGFCWHEYDFPPTVPSIWKLKKKFKIGIGCRPTLQTGTFVIWWTSFLHACTSTSSVRYLTEQGIISTRIFVRHS